MNKVLALILIFSLAFNIAFVGIWLYVRNTRPGRAAPLGPRGPVPTFQRGSAPRPDGRRWAGLGLTPQQRQRLDASLRQLRERLGKLNEQVRKDRDRLLDLLAQDPIDRAAVKQVQQRIDAAQREIRELVLQEMMRTCEVLTPEQRRRWAAMMKAIGRGRMHRMHSGAGRVPPAGPPQQPGPPHGPGMMMP